MMRPTVLADAQARGDHAPPPEAVVPTWAERYLLAVGLQASSLLIGMAERLPTSQPSRRPPARR